jgi:hypothetical protein
VKAALIPPAGYEETALASDIHLVLPLPTLVTNQTYIDTYRKAAARGDYIILDNGVAEGDLRPTATIMHMARTVGAHEIVAPDVMGDMSGTRALTRKFLASAGNIDDYNVMGVCQGANWPEVHTLIEFFARYPYITTLGIPKVHLARGLTARFDIVTKILDRYGSTFKIHLLGAHRNAVAELWKCDFPAQVRSTDSTLPYKFARHFTPLSDALASDDVYFQRWDGYFSHRVDISAMMLNTNISTYKEWARRNEG